MNLDDEELRATRGDKLEEYKNELMTKVKEVDILKNYLAEKGLISDYIRYRKSNKN